MTKEEYLKSTNSFGVVKAAAEDCKVMSVQEETFLRTKEPVEILTVTYTELIKDTNRMGEPSGRGRCHPSCYRQRAAEVGYKNQWIKMRQGYVDW